MKHIEDQSEVEEEDGDAYPEAIPKLDELLEEEETAEENGGGRKRFSAFSPVPSNLHFPFHGGYEGSSWNTQALLARNPFKHMRKTRVMRNTIRNRDFPGLVDVHGKKGEGDAVRLPPGIKGWWSHGSEHRGGGLCW